jgi:multiple sugar transport system permease protein
MSPAPANTGGVTLAGRRSAGPRHRLGAWLDREETLGYVLVTPLVLLLLGFVAYPFAIAVQFSLSDRTLAEPGRFVGIENVWNLWDNQIYRQTVRNTVIYALAATILKLGAGFALALVVNERLPWKRLLRSAILLPWIVPTVLSTMAWLWLLTPNFSVINWVLVRAGVSRTGLPWLTDPNLALFSVILVNTWRGIPFFTITLLAGLQTIPGELWKSEKVQITESTTVISRMGWTSGRVTNRKRCHFPAPSMAEAS